MNPKEAKALVQQIQKLVDTKEDGIWGPKSQAALNVVIADSKKDSDVHTVKATSFADPADIEAFKKCKAEGGTDQECFKAGDNGIGAWGDDTTVDVPIVALPYEDIIEEWGSLKEARGRRVEVTYNKQTVIARLLDRMPHRDDITNGAGIDMNYNLCQQFGLNPPVDVEVTWKWYD